MSPREGERVRTIGELAAEAGVSRRTVRFYVQRGLIDAPVGKGRGAGYADRHLQQLRRVLRFQREGLRLTDIQEVLARAADGDSPLNLETSSTTGTPRSSADDPTEAAASWPLATRTVVRFDVAPGVALEFDSRVAVPDLRTLQRLAAVCRRILEPAPIDGDS